MKRFRSSSPKEPSKKHKLTVADYLDRENDRISQLPKLILLNILSLLPTEDALKTSFLSKTWYSISNSFPVFDFDQDNFNVNKGGRSFKEGTRAFVKYIHKTIDRRCKDITNIREFKLAVRFNNTDLKSRLKDLDKWLNFAVSNNVENLVFHYYKRTTSKKAWPYVLPTPFPLFGCSNKSLKELDLFGCKFVDSSGGIDQIGFSLKKLKLTHVDINDQALQSLLSSCSNTIEELRIRHCEGFRSVKISSITLKIADLYLSRNLCQKIAIEAQNLRFLSFAGYPKNVQASLEASNIERCHYCLFLSLMRRCLSNYVVKRQNCTHSLAFIFNDCFTTC